MQIKEVIVVEGRDDTAAIKRALTAATIETHGYGISKATWQALENAYKESGLIIFTDPDWAGNRIRRRLMERFPDAKQAFLKSSKAEKAGDIGIENATPEDIAEAIAKAKPASVESKIIFTMSDLDAAGLTGDGGAKERRELLGDALGIGYGNAKAFLNKLNLMGVTREEFEDARGRIRE